MYVQKLNVGVKVVLGTSSPNNSIEKFLLPEASAFDSVSLEALHPFASIWSHRHETLSFSCVTYSIKQRGREESHYTGPDD